MKPIRVSLLLWAIALALPSRGLAQWQLNGAAVCTANYPQYITAIVSDGAGGAIIAWEDERNGSGYDIYAQRLNSAGLPQWTANGVALCAVFGYQSRPTIISDGAGGAIVTWDDFRSASTYDIYAQRVSATGVPQWTANGVALCTAASHQYYPTIANDGAGGAIVTWYDERNWPNLDIYAQRVSASGVSMWTTNGVGICTAADLQVFPTIVSDGAGGAIVVWQDQRSGINTDIYSQRVNASGVAQWTANGVAICTAVANQFFPKIVSDNAGGAVVTWYDYRLNSQADIYAQRVNPSGFALWAANGVALCTAGNDQTAPVIVSDGAGGAIVTWKDSRSGAVDIFAQRVNPSGVPLWTANGAALCTAANDQDTPAIISDGAEGAIVTWRDLRGGSISDIYAQRVNASGVPQWAANGDAVCTATADQNTPAIAPDGLGGAIVTWMDFRSGLGGTSWDIYAQRLGTGAGEWGHPEPWITSVSDVPGDQGGKVAVNWWASDLDKRPHQTITHYSVWRAVDLAAFSTLASTGAGPPLVDASAIGSEFHGTAIRHERIATTDYYWEWVGNQTFRYSATYSFSAATRADSITGDPADHCFQVLAHTSDPFVFWESNVMCGYSVDNLAPAAPLSLTALRVGGNVNLKWNRVRVPDLRDYSVYRATSTGVTPVPINFLAASDDTVLIDGGAPASALYYIVTAHDVHENQSAPSNEASVGATTGVGNVPSITALTVLQNYPNPFAGSTEMEVGLPANSDVSIQIYDVAGRVVREETQLGLNAGWRRIAIDGRDARGQPLASGVYFCRVTASGATVTRKLVIAR